MTAKYVLFYQSDNKPGRVSDRVKPGKLETTKHYLLQCSNYSNNRFILFDELRNLNVIIFPFNPTQLCRILLYGNPVLDNDINREILNAVVNFIELTSRFSGSLFE